MNQQQKKLALARITSIMNTKLSMILKEEKDWINDNPILREPSIGDIIDLIESGKLPLIKFDKEDPVHELKLKEKAGKGSNLSTFFDFDHLDELRKKEAANHGILVHHSYHRDFVSTTFQLKNPLAPRGEWATTFHFDVPQFIDCAKEVHKKYIETIDIVTFGEDSEILATIQELEKQNY